MSYTLHEHLAASGNYGGSRTAPQIKYLVIHYTGNDGDTAKNNAVYYQNNVVRASAHYFVDDAAVYRSVPDLRVAWAVGGTKWADCARTSGGSMYGLITNTNSLSVELCDTVKDGNYGVSEATLSNAVALCVKLMEKYSIPMERVYRHFDVTGKHCPAYMMEPAEWQAFRERLRQRLNDNLPAAYAREAVAWAAEHGIMTGTADGDLMLTQPLTRQQFATMLWRYHQMKH